MPGPAGLPCLPRSGRSTRVDAKPEPGVVGGDEPLAEWERELAEGAKSAEAKES